MPWCLSSKPSPIDWIADLYTTKPHVPSFLQVRIVGKCSHRVTHFVQQSEHIYVCPSTNLIKAFNGRKHFQARHPKSTTTTTTTVPPQSGSPFDIVPFTLRTKSSELNYCKLKPEFSTFRLCAAGCWCPVE